MKVENYLRIYNGLARWIGFTPIERVDAPHEKGKTYKQVKINTFPFFLQQVIKSPTKLQNIGQKLI